MSRLKDAWSVLIGKKKLKTVNLNAEEFLMSELETVISYDGDYNFEIGGEVKAGDISGLVVKKKAIVVTKKELADSIREFEDASDELLDICKRNEP